MAQPSAHKSIARLLAAAWAAVALATLALFALTIGPWLHWQVATPEPVAIAAPEEPVENGIHLATGLIHAEGFELVRANCVGCHSAQLIVQNRNNREGWAQLIEWMQETQGLWDLGQQQDPILTYLSTHYAPQYQSRRPSLQLSESDWYLLEE